jgi:hypothetical protein
MHMRRHTVIVTHDPQSARRMSLMRRDTVIVTCAPQSARTHTASTSLSVERKK